MTPTSESAGRVFQRGREGEEDSQFRQRGRATRGQCWLSMAGERGYAAVPKKIKRSSFLMRWSWMGAVRRGNERLREKNRGRETIGSPTSKHVWEWQSTGSIWGIRLTLREYMSCTYTLDKARKFFALYGWPFSQEFAKAQFLLVFNSGHHFRSLGVIDMANEWTVKRVSPLPLFHIQRIKM